MISKVCSTDTVYRKPPTLIFHKVRSTVTILDYQANTNGDGAMHLMKNRNFGLYYKRYRCYAPLKLFQQLSSYIKIIMVLNSTNYMIIK